MRKREKARQHRSYAWLPVEKSWAAWSGMGFVIKARAVETMQAASSTGAARNATPGVLQRATRGRSNALTGRSERLAFSDMSKRERIAARVPSGARLPDDEVQPQLELAIAPGERETPVVIFKRALASRALRYTRERAEILREVLGTHEHFDANALYDLLARRKAHVSRATVYRTLTLLRECRILREVFHTPEGARYEHVYGHTHHEHMICMVCQKVFEFSSPELERIQEKACRENSFEPVRHHLEILGYCRDCRSRRTDG